MRTIKNIIQHELIGLHCKISDSKNKSQAGIEGKVIDETQKTIVIETIKGSKRILKATSTFRFLVNGRWVEVPGKLLVGRPEDRIKKRVKKW